MNQQVKIYREKFRVFHNKYGDIISAALGIGVMLVSIAIIIIALNIRHTGQTTQDTARVQCNRTVLFSPFVYKFFRDNNVLPRDVVIDGKHHDLLAEYSETIPKGCS